MYTEIWSFFPTGVLQLHQSYQSHHRFHHLPLRSLPWSWLLVCAVPCQLPLARWRSVMQDRRRGLLSLAGSHVLRAWVWLPCLVLLPYVVFLGDSGVVWASPLRHSVAPTRGVLLVVTSLLLTVLIRVLASHIFGSVWSNWVSADLSCRMCSLPNGPNQNFLPSFLALPS